MNKYIILSPEPDKKTFTLRGNASTIKKARAHLDGLGQGVFWIGKIYDIVSQSPETVVKMNRQTTRLNTKSKGDSEGAAGS